MGVSFKDDDVIKENIIDLERMRFKEEMNIIEGKIKDMEKKKKAKVFLSQRKIPPNKTTTKNKQISLILLIAL